MEELTGVSRAEYDLLRKIKQKPKQHKARPGKDEQMLLAFSTGDRDHGVLTCDSYAKAVAKTNALRVSAQRVGVAVRIEQRKEKILISKI